MNLIKQDNQSECNLKKAGFAMPLSDHLIQNVT